MRRCRVLFVGFEPFWMRVAVDGLMKRYPDELDCRWMVWPSTLGERVRFVAALLRADLVLRLGMPFEFQSETNRFFLLMLKLVPWMRGGNYWIGSDVAEFLERRARGELSDRDRSAIARLHHFAGTQTLAERLREVGVPAVSAVLMGPERDIPDEIPPFPESFRVLGYWNDSRFEYCGGPEVIEAARQMPDVEFDVLGTEGASASDVPPNMTLHGVVDDVLGYVERSVVYVRLVAGDALPSSMVEEALLLGRYVVYSMEWPHTIHLPRQRPAELVAVLRELQARHARGELALNIEGREFTQRDSDADAQAAMMRAAILDACRGAR